MVVVDQTVFHVDPGTHLHNLATYSDHCTKIYLSIYHQVWPTFGAVGIADRHTGVHPAAMHC